MDSNKHVHKQATKETNEKKKKNMYELLKTDLKLFGLKVINK